MGRNGCAAPVTALSTLSTPSNSMSRSWTTFKAPPKGIDTYGTFLRERMRNAPPTPGSPASTSSKLRKSRKKKGPQEWRCADPSLLTSDEDESWPVVGDDPFGTFLAARPRPAKRAMAKSERDLRLRLLETKQHLLQACLWMEIDQLKPANNPFAPPRTRIDVQARRYLRNPERVLDALSDAGSESDVQSEAANEIIEDQEVTIAKATLRSSASAPSLGRKTTTMGLGSTSLLPPIPFSTKHADQLGMGPLAGWWTATRTWNAGLGRSLRLRRLDPKMAGGCVALGDGKLELVQASPNQGYFYALRIEAVDEDLFPAATDSKSSVLSSGFGFSRLSPSQPACEKPMFAYEIPHAVLVGYNGHVIDDNRWKPASWDPRELQVGDELGLFVALQSADLFVLVNGAVKLRLETSLKPAAKDASNRLGVKQSLWPLVDLHGRVTAVSLLPQAQPPAEPIR